MVVLVGKINPLPFFLAHSSSPPLIDEKGEYHLFCSDFPLIISRRVSMDIIIMKN